MRLTLSISLLFLGCSGGSPDSRAVRPKPAFQVLRDGGFNVVDIGVDASASPDEIRSALVVAADALAGIRGRDLFLGDRVFFRAFLVREGRESVKMCARLSRYVPLPGKRSLWEQAFSVVRALGTADRFRDQCEEARSGSFRPTEYDKFHDPSRRAGG